MDETLSERAELLARLRKVDPDTPGIRTRWLQNPDGPDAARAIEVLAGENAALVTDMESIYASLNTEANARIDAESERDAALARVRRLEGALKPLIALYVANVGSAHEFITCITAKHASGMTGDERATSKVWRAWDEARAAMKEQGE